MKRILIIENEFPTVQVAFDAANTIHFNGELQFEHIAKSQDINWKTINKYHCIFVDISLAMRSDLDGLGILGKIQAEYPSMLPRTAIITGHHKILDVIKGTDLQLTKKQVILKPLKYIVSIRQSTY